VSQRQTLKVFARQTIQKHILKKGSYSKTLYHQTKTLERKGLEEVHNDIDTGSPYKLRATPVFDYSQDFH